MKKFRALVLCGLPMCGKTSVGKNLAETLNWNFIDTDRLIEESYLNQTGKQNSCREIFKTEGNVFFRDLEAKVITSLKLTKNSVIATGGGTLSSKENIGALKNLGTLIYLKATIGELLDRIVRDQMPAYLDKNDPRKSFLELAEKRIPIYENTAHYTVDTSNLTEKEIAAKIEKAGFA